MPAFRAVGVEQKIVKIPKYEVVVAFVRTQPIAVGGVELEKDLAIYQQAYKFDARKAASPPELIECLRR